MNSLYRWMLFAIILLGCCCIYLQNEASYWHNRYSREQCDHLKTKIERVEKDGVMWKRLFHALKVPVEPHQETIERIGRLWGGDKFGIQVDENGDAKVIKGAPQ